MSLTKSNCSATHTSAPTSPTRRVPMVRTEPKSATGGGSAGPNTERPLSSGIPHRLRCDSVAPSAHRPYEYVHLFHLAIFDRSCQAKSLLEGRGRPRDLDLCTQICESRARG